MSIDDDIALFETVPILALLGRDALRILAIGADTISLETGDTLFPGGPGRTTDPQEFDQLINDLEVRIFQRLPDETWFYPGHGNDSTLGAERPKLPDWRARGW